MPEGYFPDGEPEREEQMTPQMLQAIFDQYQNQDQLDLRGHLNLIDEVLKLVPYSAKMWNLRGTVLLDLGEQENEVKLLHAAKEAYLQSLDLEPDNFDAMLDLGYYVLHVEKDAEQAKKLLEPCLEHYTQRSRDAMEGLKEVGTMLAKQKKKKLPFQPL